MKQKAWEGERRNQQVNNSFSRMKQVGGIRQHNLYSLKGAEMWVVYMQMAAG